MVDPIPARVPGRDPDAPDPPRSVPRISSDELLGDRGQIVIEHDGREYQLRITRSGKLILTA